MTEQQRVPWPVLLLGAIIVLGIGAWIDRLLTMPPGVLHTLIPVSFVVGTCLALAKFTRPAVGPWQSWFFMIFFTFRMFEPTDRRWLALDVIGMLVLFYTLLTRKQWARPIE